MDQLSVGKSFAGRPVKILLWIPSTLGLQAERRIALRQWRMVSVGLGVCHAYEYSRRGVFDVLPGKELPPGSVPSGRPHGHLDVEGTHSTWEER